MSTPLLAVLVTAAAVCVLTLIGAVWGLWGSARRFGNSVQDMRTTREPEINTINDDLAVARSELERIQDAIDELKASRDR